MTRPSPGWRAVYFVQRVISAVAPPLHSLHWKIFALLLVGLFLPAVYFAWQVSIQVERGHLRATEQGMIDTALVLADALALAKAEPGAALSDLSVARQTSARVFRDSAPDLRVVLYDPTGRVVSDTAGALAPGTDAAALKEVRQALAGRHGARWESDSSRGIVTLHCAIPIYQNGALAGLIGVIKPTTAIRHSILRSLWDLALPAWLAFVVAAGTSYLLSSYLTRVITDLASRATRIAEGEEGVRLETWTRSELGDLARAVETMRRKLEGRAYIEEMASTLSHELKTPLASIRGAAEILEDNQAPEIRVKFLANIQAEVDRLTGIVDNLLALSRIESRPAEAPSSCRPADIVREVGAVYRQRAETLALRFEISNLHGSDLIAAAPDDLRRVLEILLDNAFAFTPSGKSVRLESLADGARIQDAGQGIDPALQGRIFERFFTTINPLTGRRGTGLGLAIARSITARRQGTLTLRSEPGQGTEATVVFPKIS